MPSQLYEIGQIPPVGEVPERMYAQVIRPERFDEPSDFHIGGSDASGIVYAVGSGVENVAVGDHVVIHCGQWDADDPFIADGGDPGFSDSYRIWGYESNW